ncbi:MAG: hypothetical protein KAU95_03535 [Candidatus Aenigmarchaeota archaeon]|nr:hypothetical protein [Candidatus Aenigmarchaeota archaeon]
MELIERVRKILEDYSICDECLGRQFHALLPKIPNKEKGQTLRNYVRINSVFKDEKSEFKKEETCCLCNNIFDKMDFYIGEVKKKIKKYEFNTMLIGSKIPAELISKEEDFWEEEGVDLCEAIKSDFNREIGYRIKNLTNKKIEFDNPDIMIVVNPGTNEINLQISPLYIMGKYKKILPKGKLQNIIGNALVKDSKACEAVFYSIGRLEQNVTTSCYRPFVVMLKNPEKRKLELKKIRKKINKLKSISVSTLDYSDRDEIDNMKNEKITATYSITLEVRKKLDIKEARKKLMRLKNKRITQFLKQKTRNPYIRKINVRVSGKNLTITMESTVGFSINSFLEGKSKPNLKKLIGENFKIKKIVLKNYRKMKGHEMYS